MLLFSLKKIVSVFILSKARVSEFLSTPAPGAVTPLMAIPTLTSIKLRWTSPEEPNGIIIGYDVTFSINGNNNSNTSSVLSTTFTIPSLTPGTTVSQISVTAYTSIGPGVPTTLEDTTTLLEPRKLAEFYLSYV